jgi:hypothetical protein
MTLSNLRSSYTESDSFPNCAPAKRRLRSTPPSAPPQWFVFLVTSDGPVGTLFQFFLQPTNGAVAQSMAQTPIGTQPTFLTSIYWADVKMRCEKVNSLRKKFTGCTVWLLRQTFCFHKDSELIAQLSDYELQVSFISHKNAPICRLQQDFWTRDTGANTATAPLRRCSSAEEKWLDSMTSGGGGSALLSGRELNE